MANLIKYKRVLFTVFFIISLVIYVWFSYFKIDYTHTKWLSLHGYKSKGYEPYLETVYAASGDTCKDFIFGLGSSLAKNDKQIFMSKVTEDDLHYTIKYPMNFEKGGCSYWFGRGYIYIQEYNTLDEKKYPRKKVLRSTKIYDDFVGVIDIKYFKPDEVYTTDARNSNLFEVNQYCQRTLTFSSRPYYDDNMQKKKRLYRSKGMTCHPEGFYGKKPLYFFKPFMLTHPNIPYNIIVSDDIQSISASKEQVEETNLKPFLLRDFSPSEKVFKNFKKEHKIKE